MSRFLKEYIVKNSIHTGEIMKEKLIYGTVLLTVSGLLCRLIGFFYRVFLAREIGAEGMGIYQLVIPVYHLGYAICTAGIQTALSRLIASYTAKKNHEKALLIFLLGTSVSFLFSVAISLLIWGNAAILAKDLLGDPQSTPLLKLLAYALPFGSIHGCIVGWFMGKKEIHIPAAIQVLEELMRLIATFSICQYLTRQHLAPNAAIAIVGLIVCEAISALISLIFIFHSIHPHKPSHQHFPFNMEHSLKEVFFQKTDQYTITELFSNALPLTVNRIALNLLHSAEAILIPLSLQKCNLSRTTALETLGIITGMSLPLVLFPTAIINALSSVLIPAISESQAVGDKNNIRKLVRKTLIYATIIGSFFSIFFTFFGTQIGILIYQSPKAGHYISALALICPFLFWDIILASILNGLGKTFLCFFINLFNMVFRIFCICILIPQIGLYGYLIGLIGGEVLCSLLSFILIRHLVYTKSTHI